MAAYTAVVLTEDSRTALLDRFRSELPSGWEIDADHMTINLGSADRGPAADRLGEAVHLTIVSIARDERVIAAGVESVVPTDNAVPHVTLAVNTTEGGRSRDANELTKWSPVEPQMLRGRIAEVE
jgi:hypothetical protein